VPGVQYLCHPLLITCHFLTCKSLLWHLNLFRGTNNSLLEGMKLPVFIVRRSVAHLSVRRAYLPSSSAHLGKWRHSFRICNLMARFLCLLVVRVLKLRVSSGSSWLTWNSSRKPGGALKDRIQYLPLKELLHLPASRFGEHVGRAIVVNSTPQFRSSRLQNVTSFLFSVTTILRRQVTICRSHRPVPPVFCRRTAIST
jgi:hypothetical protein